MIAIQNPRGDCLAVFAFTSQSVPTRTDVHRHGSELHVENNPIRKEQFFP